MCLDEQQSKAQIVIVLDDIHLYSFTVYGVWQRQHA
jgi:hypothetical protein